LNADVPLRTDPMAALAPAPTAAPATARQLKFFCSPRRTSSSCSPALVNAASPAAVPTVLAAFNSMVDTLDEPAVDAPVVPTVVATSTPASDTASAPAVGADVSSAE
jgi:hypothetical protein